MLSYFDNIRKIKTFFYDVLIFSSTNIFQIILLYKYLHNCIQLLKLIESIIMPVVYSKVVSLETQLKSLQVSLF